MARLSWEISRSIRETHLVYLLEEEEGVVVMRLVEAAFSGEEGVPQSSSLLVVPNLLQQGLGEVVGLLEQVGAEASC